MATREPARNWAFAPGFPEPRRLVLDTQTEFDAIVDAVIRSMSGILVSVEDGMDYGMTGCERPIVTFSARGAFDAFFNSVGGYRGQFWRDPHYGQASNSLVLRRVLKALDNSAMSELERLCTFNVDTYFDACSAKIWVHEDDFPLYDPTEDLAVEPWLSAARAGIPEARRGLCAPAEARLRMFGAFIDSVGHERVSKYKIRRRYYLHDWGFT